MQSINYLVPLITLPYLTRTLGLESFGILNLSISLIQYAILLINFGFNLSSTEYIAKNRNNNKLISACFWNTISAKLILFVLSLVIMSILIVSVDEFYQIKWVIFICLLQTIGIAIDPIWFFQGIEKLGSVSLINSLVKILNIPLLVIFVHTSGDLYAATLIHAVIYVIIGINNLYLVKREQIITRVNIKQLQIGKTIKQSLPIFIGTAAVSLYNTSTPVILGIVSTYGEVGIYSASFKLYAAAVGVFLALGQVFYPRINHLFSIGHDQAYKFIRKLSLILLPLTVVGFLFFYFVLPIITPMILGQQFENTALTIKILSPMVILTPYAVIFSNYLLLPLGHRKIFYMAPLITGIMHLSYAILLSKYYGAVGASISITLTEVVSCSILAYFVLRKTSFFKSKIIHGVNN